MHVSVTVWIVAGGQRTVRAAIECSSATDKASGIMRCDATTRDPAQEVSHA